MQLKSYSNNPNLAPLRPQSGIDKIKIQLNTLVITPLFKDAVSINNPFTLFPGNNSICLQKQSSYYFLILNQEFFDFSQNILLQLFSAVSILVQNGFLLPSIVFNPFSYISHVSEIEFYFDNARKNLWIPKNRAFPNINQARENFGFYQYSDEFGNVTDTFYSSDYQYHGTKKFVNSTVTVYDKEQKDLASIVNKKGISKQQQIQQIECHKWKTRLEFRLSRDNCFYLNIQNLQGNYSQVLGRYKELLAFLYNRFCRGNILYAMRSNTALDRIVRKANETHYKVNFMNSNGKLVKG